jgi:hypothetical protein
VVSYGIFWCGVLLAVFSTIMIGLAAITPNTLEETNEVWKLSNLLQLVGLFLIAVGWVLSR